MNLRRIVKKLIPRTLFEHIEPTGHLLESVLWNVVYGFPGRGLKVIGVTGTNGKTTTCFLLHRMLLESGYQVGLMTTVGYGVGSDIKPQGRNMTNLPTRAMMQRLRQMKAEGMEWLVLETTSMALAQYRTWGVPYSIAVITNITQDHLDYHKTFQRYAAAKRRLFTLAARNRRGRQLGVVNADDERSRGFADGMTYRASYGIEAGDIRATDIALKPGGMTYTAEASDESYHITSHLTGSFNVYNTLAAVCVGRALGLTREQIEQGIAALSSVDGRLQPVDVGQPFAVVVDYAHTPDALENVLTALRGTCEDGGKLAIVFGATGDRDATKRPLMGEVAARLADRIYLTDDETYSEDPAKIRDMVMQGIEPAGAAAKTQVIANREEAIRQALTDAKPGDTVLLAGIGHQKYRAMGEGKLPWDEPELAAQILHDLRNKA